jgi:hypothetical protein
MCFEVDSAQIPKSEKSNPEIPSGRPCQPSRCSSVKQHPFGRRSYSIWTPLSAQNLRTVQGCIPLDISATRPDAIQCSTSKRISFANIDMRRQMQPSRRQVYTIWKLSLIRQDMEKIWNRLDDRSTSFGMQSLLWKLRTVEVQQSGR